MKRYTFAAIGAAATILRATLAFSASGQYELLLSGPVESIDSGARTVTVLGHTMVVRDPSKLLAGQKVNVYGVITRAGLAKAKIVQNLNYYSASGDAVFVSGMVHTVDVSRGWANVEGANVDYTALLSRPGFTLPAVGASVRIYGSQPSGKGVVLAQNIVVVARVTAGGQAVGVSGSSQAAGVSGSSQAAGVSGSSFLWRAFGVSGSSQAVGVSGSSQAAGVSGSSFLWRAFGVSGSSQAVGVSGSSQAAGVSGSSQAAGVSGSSQVVGVSGSSQAAGVSGSSQAAGVSGSSQAVGVSGSSQAVGVSGSSQAVGVSGSSSMSRS